MTLLLVDDDDSVRLMMQLALTLRGFQVETACDGFEALTMLALQPYDAVVSDVTMPGMKGEALAFRVRELYPTMRTVLISGAVRDNDLVCPTVSASFAKPVDLDALQRFLMTVPLAFA